MWTDQHHVIQLLVKNTIPKAAEKKVHDLEPGDWIVGKDFRRKGSQVDRAISDTANNRNSSKSG